MCGEHFSEVLRESINVFLEEEKGGTDGTPLSFVNDKGEFLHGVRQPLSLSFQANDGCGGNNAAC